MTTLHVRGTPRPQPRARFVGRGVAKRVVSTANKAAKQWRALVTAAARRALDAGGPLAGELELDAVFYFSTAKTERHGRPHAAKPDADNLVKLVMDACADAGLLTKGDATVARVISLKLWAALPGAVIELRPFGTRVTSDDDDDLGANILETQPGAV